LIDIFEESGVQTEDIDEDDIQVLFDDEDEEDDD